MKTLVIYYVKKSPCLVYKNVMIGDSTCIKCQNNVQTKVKENFVECSHPKYTQYSESPRKFKKL